MIVINNFNDNFLSSVRQALCQTSYIQGIISLDPHNYLCGQCYNYSHLLMKTLSVGEIK